jgi:hypothetical protein
MKLTQSPWFLISPLKFCRPRLIQGLLLVSGVTNRANSFKSVPDRVFKSPMIVAPKAGSGTEKVNVEAITPLPE